VRFASRQPALLDIVFTSLHRPGADPSLRQANDRAFAAPIALIADAQRDGEIGGEIVAGDPDRVSMTVLATPQGLAWLANSSVIGDRPIDTFVAKTIETLTKRTAVSTLLSPSPRPSGPRCQRPDRQHRDLWRRCNHASLAFRRLQGCLLHLCPSNFGSLSGWAG
jgi:hypothetical protein